MRLIIFLFLVLSISLNSEAKSKVLVGVDVLFQKNHDKEFLKGKNLGLITNQTAINQDFQSTLEIIRTYPHARLAAIFAPEHGIDGMAYASESVQDQKYFGIPVFSLHGKTRRPTAQMLKNIDVLIFDIQDIGSRSYTFISTLFYCMEEAAKQKIKVLVLDRPNPLNGLIVDGPLLDPKWRSFVGYINVPYCHGMTIGELAKCFNEEYKVKCDLNVIPMEGWKRWMSFKDTGLVWIPTSPQIPEEDSPFYYPTTGLLGELSIVNIGVGYTLPFKVIGAPWINAEKLAQQLNQQKLIGVYFQPFHYRPFFGKFNGEDCHGIKIIVTNHRQFMPMTTQYCIIGLLKSLYPAKFQKGLEESYSRQEMFTKVNGKEEVYKLISEEGFITWKLREICKADREQFMPIRKKYLITDYE